MSGHAAKNRRVLVLYFALNDSLAKGSVICRRRNFGFPTGRRIERGLQHSKWPEELALAKTVKRFLRDFLEGQTQQDETNVAIFGMASRSISQRNRKCKAQQLFSASTAQIELVVRRQS